MPICGRCGDCGKETVGLTMIIGKVETFLRCDDCKDKLIEEMKSHGSKPETRREVIL